MPRYITTFDHRVAGIPCQIAVTYYHRTVGSYSYNAACDLDYHGGVEADYQVLDRRGRPAPWLERKVDTAEDENIIDAIAYAMGGQ